MGIDISGGPSFNWSGWRYLFEVGVAFGWKPAGTEKPLTWYDSDDKPIWGGWDEATQGAWSGSYFSNDCQVVSTHDTAEWRSAIAKALCCVNGEAEPETDEQKKLLEGAGEEDVELFESFIESTCSAMVLM